MFLLCTLLAYETGPWLRLPDNKPSLRVIHRLGLPYIENRMHAKLTHRFFALTREAYISAHYDARQKA